MGQPYNEFKPFIYILAAFGLFHFMKDRAASRCLKIITFSYFLIRVTFSSITAMVVFVSVFRSSDLTQKVNPIFDTLSSLTSSCHLFYLCSSNYGFFEFLQTLKRSGESKGDTKRIIWLAIGIGIACTLPLQTINAIYFLQNDSGHQLVFVPFLSIFNLDVRSFKSSLKIYALVENGIFGQFTYVFCPLFYSTIAIKVGAEFWEWHKSLSRKISSKPLHVGAETLEELRLQYEELVKVVRFADRFMSSFLGINLVLHLANIFFLSYNVIMFWELWKLFSIYIIYGILIIAILILSSSMITRKVSAMEMIKLP